MTIIIIIINIIAIIIIIIGTPAGHRAAPDARKESFGPAAPQPEAGRRRRTERHRLPKGNSLVWPHVSHG
eukprot:3737958-Pyramimonas_sp.AAC.1